MARDALVMPSRILVARAGFRSVSPAATRAAISSLASRNSDLSMDEPTISFVLPASSMRTLRHHLQDDDLNVLIADIHALQAVDLLAPRCEVVLHGNGPLMARIS